MIVDEAVAAFARDRAERAAVPAVAALRTHFEAERRRLLAGHADLDAASATRLLVNRLLHAPSEALRALAADGSGEGLAERAAAERLMFRLFGLDRVTGAALEETERDKDERREPGREVR